MNDTVEIHTRNVPRDKWLELKAEAARRQLELGPMLGEMIAEWMAAKTAGDGK